VFVAVYRFTRSSSQLVPNVWRCLMLKPTLEQISAVESVAVALSALEELWSEDMGAVFNQLGEDITGDILALPIYSLAGSWRGAVYALKDLTNSNKPWVCSRCLTPVNFDDVTLGYFATCPEHDEDLNEWECEKAVSNA
jgi:hypothetical protein